MRRAAVLIAIVLLACCAGVVLATPGDLDPTFDGDGKKTFGYGGDDVAEAVAVQPDGKVLVAGYGNPGPDMAITRLNADGSFDTSFDVDETSGDFGGQDYGYAMALQSNGKIVVVGRTNVDQDVAVARWNPDGSLDTSFDGDGKRVFGYGGIDEARAVAIQPDGKILIAGYGNPGPDMALTRLNADGSFDTSFDVDGTFGADFGGEDYGYAMALQPNGKIVVAGRTRTNIDSDYDIAVARWNPDGSLDTSFDGDGKKTFGYGDEDEAHGVAVQPDGKILIAGYGNPARDLAITRLNPDGSFDTGFDGDGTFGADFGAFDRGLAMALQPNGKIVVVGRTTAGSNYDVAVARFQPGSPLDSTFNFDGKQTIDFGGNDNANALALQPNGAIVIAGSTSVGQDIAVARIEGDPPSGGGGGGGGSGGGGPGGGGGSPPRCLGKRATIVGTSRSERLSGTRRADVIAALGGNDRVSGLGANDRICGGAGNDRLSGGTGNDRLDGGDGHDALKGEAGNDKLAGAAGRDRLNGGKGRDNCNGGAGNDRATCERERRI